MTAYEDARDADFVPIVIMVTFTSIPTSYFSRDWDGRTTSATGGLKLSGKIMTTANARNSTVNIGNFTFQLIDTDGAITSWLEANDEGLAATRVDVRVGTVDLAEANFQTKILFVTDYRQIRASRGRGDKAAYRFTVSDIFNMMDKPVHENIDKPDYVFSEDPSEFTLGPSDLTITVDDDDIENQWPSSGHLILYDKDADHTELVAYSAISGFDITVSARNVESTGITGKTWPTETRVTLVWYKKGHPLDVMREFMTGTTGGLNGPHDLGDGIGIGDLIPTAAIDHTDIDNQRDAFAKNWVFFWVEQKEIGSVRQFAFKQCLQAAGFYPSITSEGKFTVIPMWQFPPVTTDIASDFDPVRDNNWNRNWPKRENNVIYKMDKNPGGGVTNSRTTLATGSQSKFGKSSEKLFKGDGVHGAASPRFGMPDLGGDAIADYVSVFFLLEFANPPPTFRLRCPYKYKDLQVGYGLKMNHTTLRVVGKSTVGTTGDEIFIIEKTTNDISSGKTTSGMVDMNLRHRRDPFQRLAFIVPDANTEDYGSATEEEKVYCYFSNGDADFADGKKTYKFITSSDGSLE